MYNVVAKNMCECSTEKLRDDILKIESIKEKYNKNLVEINISEGDSIRINNLTEEEKNLLVSDLVRYEDYYVYNQETNKYE
jgi:hypothetical protein